VNIPRFAVNNKSLVLAVLMLALLWSMATAVTMQRREDPAVTQRRAEVVTFWPGASTEDVEQLITKKIADEIRGVAHVQDVEGVSRPGISVIDVYLDDQISQADPVLRDIRDHVDDVKPQLPSAVTGPVFIDDIWKTYPIVLGVFVPGYTPRQLRDFATAFKDDLSTLPDVGSVKLSGDREQTVDVDLDLRKLSGYGVTAGEIVDALGAHNAIVPNGSAVLGGRIAQIDPADALHDSADVAGVTVGAPGGRVVHVADVATVSTGYPDPPTELVHVDGEPGIALAIQAKETSSLTALAPEVRGLIAQLRGQWPTSATVEFLADQPASVNARVNDFWFNLILAVVLVTGLVALFMGLRNGLLVGATVAISIILTLGVLPLFSVDINQISLLALIVSLGVIVDAGIVAIDNIELYLRGGLDRKTAAWRGVHDLWFPLLTSTLVAIFSFFPFRFLDGSVGDFVRALGVVTVIALVMSLVVAYFVTPIIGEWFALAANVRSENRLARSLRSAFDALLVRLQRAYVPLAVASLRRPILTVAVAGAGIILAVAWIPELGLQFFPAADRNQFFIDVNAPEGTDIRTTEQIVSRIEALLARKPEITTYGAFIGQGAPRFFYNVFPEQPRPSYAQILVDTVDVPSANRLVDELPAEIGATVVGARIDVKRLEQGPPLGSPIQIRLSGDDPRTLADLSGKLQDVLNGIPGALAVRDSLGVPTTKLTAQVDEARATLAGVNDLAIQQLISLAYGGVTATQIREADRQTPVVVRLSGDLRDDLDAVQAITVRNASGSDVPLGELVTIVPTTQTSISTLRDGLPTVTVFSDVRGRLASAVLADFRTRIRSLTIPPGVQLTYAGENAEIVKSFRNLGIAFVVGLLINQAILLWEFRLLRLSLVVLAAVPLGIVGAVFGLAITGNHFGFVAALGISSLGGIVTNHAIVLFEYAKRELEHGMPMEQALINAGTKRLRPVLLTVVASIAGLLPLAFSSQTLWHPFCWAVIFGLSGSMIMTLIAIPALYRLVSGKDQHPPAERGAAVSGAGVTRTLGLQEVQVR